MENDIYFEKNYAKLYEDIENGEAIFYEFKNENGRIIHSFIKREIKTQIENDNKKYFDIITPYGYGGPLIVQAVNKQKLLQDFRKNFAQYCYENSIVSELVRFHPIAKNYEDFKDLYDAKFNRYTVVTNLKDYNDPIQEEFSKRCRKDIRRVLRTGMEYKITLSPDNIDNFLTCYYSTMDRNKANSFYYFDKKYFDKIKHYFKDKTILVEALYDNKTIAAGYYFISNNIIHAHLSGTLQEYLHLSPAYMLKYGTAKWGKENGYELIHYGGGRSESLDDGLYKFKKQFGTNTEYEFWIGKKVWNKEVYEKLCKIKNVSMDEEFFPAYRKESR